MQLSSNNMLELPLLSSRGPDAIQDEKSRKWKNFSDASSLRPTGLYVNNIVWAKPE